MELRFVCPRRNDSKDLKVLYLCYLIHTWIIFFFSIASLNDNFAHCFKCTKLQQETQAIDGVVAFMDFLQTPHTYTHFADILTRLSHTHIPILQTFWRDFLIYVLNFYFLIWKNTT